MKKKAVIIVILILCLMATIVNAANMKELIEVYKNYASIILNGSDIKIKTLQYDNTQYAPVKNIVEAMGAKYEWNSETKTVSIQTVGSETINYTMKVDVFEPQLSIGSLGVNASNLDAYKLERNGEKVEVQLEIEEEHIKLYNDTWLDYNSNYTLKLFMNDGSRKIIEFETSDLPKLVVGSQRKIIYVPAMPDKGFNYPYYLVLPKKANVAKNIGQKNYLLVEPHNTGKADDDLDFHIKEAYRVAEGNSASIADELGLPRIVPIIVRPRTPIYDDQFVYTHALSRQTIYLEELKREAGTYDAVFEPMDRVDEQVVKMIEHANQYLSDNGWKMEKKVFMWGFSASGDFVSRFAFLHPDMVKAVCFGGHPIFPIAKEQGFDLIYPFGISDYKKITGKEFDLKAYNNVAKLGYAGSEDYQDDPLQYSDLYVSQEERNIVKNLLHLNKYPEGWKVMGDIFKRSGGEAQVNIYIGAGHETFYKGMTQDYLNFYKANRNSDKPVYVKPSDPASTITYTYSNNVVEMKAKPFSYDNTTIIETFWSGTISQSLPKSFVEWYKTTELYNYSESKFFISIAEWDNNKRHEQMGERIDKVGGKLTLKAEGYKDIQVYLNGDSMSDGQVQLYIARVENPQDMVSGVKYRIYDSTGHWVIMEDVYVERPNK